MKNPLKESSAPLIAALAIAVLAAGGIAFLYLTEKGKDAREGLKKKVKSIAKNAAVKAVSKKTGVKKKTVKKIADQIVSTD